MLCLYSRSGTHVDPPAHLFADRTTLDALPIEQFADRALVVNCTHLAEGEDITMTELAQTGMEKVEPADFLLFHLGWDKRWGTDSYFSDYPCIDDAVLDFILRADKKGIGFRSFQ